MRKPEEFKKAPEGRQTGGAYGQTKSDYQKPMSPTQLAWRVGLFVLGAIVGAIIANL